MWCIKSRLITKKIYCNIENECEYCIIIPNEANSIEIFEFIAFTCWTRCDLNTQKWWTLHCNSIIQWDWMDFSNWWATHTTHHLLIWFRIGFISLSRPICDAFRALSFKVGAHTSHKHADLHLSSTCYFLLMPWNIHRIFEMTSDNALTTGWNEPKSYVSGSNNLCAFCWNGVWKMCVCVCSWRGNSLWFRLRCSVTLCHPMHYFSFTLFLITTLCTRRSVCFVFLD